jgi:N-acetyl-gamma-glutamyl-phosphate reductase
MTRVFIDGAAGTTGLEIRERLAGRAELELITLDDAQRKDAGARRDALNAADIVVLCLPDDAAREAVALIDNPITRVIDASTAHRTADGWAYGFPEISGRDVVAAAKRVSNPGCYSTGFIALVAPLVRAGLVPADTPLICNAVSGYTGGGKSMIAEFEGAQGRPTAWRTYALGLNHKHLPEMRVQSGLSATPIFSPAVADVDRGMIVEVPLHSAVLPGRPDGAAVHAALQEFYAESPIVRVIDTWDEPLLTIERCRGTDRLDIFVFANAEAGQIRLIAALDNLGKGASGAAVQNLNLVGGFDETAGLLL